MDQAPVDSDEAFLLSLDNPFRDDIEQRVDLMVTRSGAPATAEALDQFAIVAQAEWDLAWSRRDDTAVVVTHAITASLRFRARRLRGELDPDHE